MGKASPLLSLQGPMDLIGKAWPSLSLQGKLRVWVVAQSWEAALVIWEIPLL